MMTRRGSTGTEKFPRCVHSSITPTMNSSASRSSGADPCFDDEEDLEADERDSFDFDEPWLRLDFGLETTKLSEVEEVFVLDSLDLDRACWSVSASFAADALVPTGELGLAEIGPPRDACIMWTPLSAGGGSEFGACVFDVDSEPCWCEDDDLGSSEAGSADEDGCKRFSLLWSMSCVIS